MLSSPCTHLSGAVCIRCDSRCWCIKPSWKAEPTDPSSPAVPRFLCNYQDSLNAHFIWPGFVPGTCCMLRHCVLPEWCPFCAGLKSGRELGCEPHGQSADRVVGTEGSAHLDSLPLWVFVAEFRGVSRESLQSRIGVQQPCCPFNLCYPKPCYDRGL